MNRRMLGSFMVAGVAWVSTPAWAATYSVKFCTEININFQDAEPGVGDDYVNDDTVDMKASGVRMQVRRNSDNVYLYDALTAATGTSEGCTSTLTLSSTETYTIRALADGRVASDNVKVYEEAPHDSDGWKLEATTLASTFTPTASGTATYTVTSQPWSVYAVASHGLKRGNGGIADATYVFRVDPDNSRGRGSVWVCEEEIIYMGAGSARKYVVLHEMGHAVAHYINGGASASKDYEGPSGNCVSQPDEKHAMNHKEYQSAAVWEGWAHFYAANAYNATTYDADCAFGYWKNLDWDLVNGVESWGEPYLAMSCEGSPYPGLSNSKYMENMCDLPHTNFGTEFDWLRFFWDLRTDRQQPFNTIAAILDGSNPEGWRAGATGTAPKPYDALLASAASISSDVGADFLAMAQWNGVDPCVIA